MANLPGAANNVFLLPSITLTKYSLSPSIVVCSTATCNTQKKVRERERQGGAERTVVVSTEEEDEERRLHVVIGWTEEERPMLSKPLSFSHTQEEEEEEEEERGEGFLLLGRSAVA